MRLLGAGLLWISLIYTGVIYSINLKKRINLIEKTIVMLEEMKIQLKYLNMPIYEMLKVISEKEYLRELDYIVNCIEELEKGLDFPIAWKKSIENTSRLYKREEIARMLQLG